MGTPTPEYPNWADPKATVEQHSPSLSDPEYAYQDLVGSLGGNIGDMSPYWWTPEAIYSIAHLPYFPDFEIHSTGNGGHNWYIQSVNRDVFTGTDADESVWGGANHDRLNGNAGRDQLFGEGGDDELRGGFGNDAIDGGADNDIIDGGNGNNSLFGGSGDDMISAGTGRSLVDGGEGDDTLFISGWDGTAYHDVDFNLALGQVRGLGTFMQISNVENVQAGGGNDRVVGNGRQNDFQGGAGDDRLLGQRGHDLLAGEEGSDTVFGGTGNDTIVSSASFEESDVLNGGAGSDVFRITCEDGLAIVQDFVSGEDILDLSWYTHVLPPDVSAGTILDLAVETPLGLLVTVTTEVDPGEFEVARILLSGIDRDEISLADILT